MGLCLSVGFMADLKDNDPEGYEDFKAILARVNQALSAEGLRPHVEPEAVKPEDSVSFDMYGYSGLHYLRRIAAHVTYAGKLPLPGDNDSSDDKLLKRYYSDSVDESPNGGVFSLFKKTGKPKSFDFNHLIQHSDCEGFYLPTKFMDVIFPDSDLKIPGAMIGSAPRLLNECQRLAEILAIPDDIRAGSDELWEASDSQGEGTGWKSYGVEAFTCIRLIDACQASIRSGAALVFA